MPDSGESWSCLWERSAASQVFRPDLTPGFTLYRYSSGWHCSLRHGAILVQPSSLLLQIKTSSPFSRWTDKRGFTWPICSSSALTRLRSGCWIGSSKRLIRQRLLTDSNTDQIPKRLTNLDNGLLVMSAKKLEPAPSGIRIIQW